EVGKWKMLKKWMRHELNGNQKKKKTRRFLVSTALILRNQSDRFLQRIKTFDE
ncbi:hypothetical protein Angca_005267, partial [Angiostrongylus cantonensis]